MATQRKSKCVYGFAQVDIINVAIHTVQVVVSRV